MSKDKECGICGSKKNLIGPYAGGPISYYCRNCKKIIDKFLIEKKFFDEFLAEIRRDKRNSGEINKRCKEHEETKE